MAKGKDKVVEDLKRYHDKIKDLYKIKKIILFGSYAKGTEKAESDIDVGVVIDEKEHSKWLDIGINLAKEAIDIDVKIETKCIFWDDYCNCEEASILAEIKKTGIEIYSS